MKEIARISRWVALKEYDHTASDEFLEVTEWANSEGFDLHLSRGHQNLSLTWNEFSALQSALGDWIDQPDPDAARRPKPPSLKEQALAHLDSLHADLKRHGFGTNTDTIRRALEQLDD